VLGHRSGAIVSQRRPLDASESRLANMAPLPATTISGAVYDGVARGLTVSVPVGRRQCHVDDIVGIRKVEILRALHSLLEELLDRLKAS
jgi:hypothetical protein